MLSVPAYLEPPPWRCQNVLTAPRHFLAPVSASCQKNQVQTHSNDHEWEFRLPIIENPSLCIGNHLLLGNAPIRYGDGSSDRVDRGLTIRQKIHFNRASSPLCLDCQCYIANLVRSIQVGGGHPCRYTILHLFPELFLAAHFALVAEFAGPLNGASLPAPGVPLVRACLCGQPDDLVTDFPGSLVHPMKCPSTDLQRVTALPVSCTPHPGLSEWPQARQVLAMCNFPRPCPAHLPHHVSRQVTFQSLTDT